LRMETARQTFAVEEEIRSLQAELEAVLGQLQEQGASVSYRVMAPSGEASWYRDADLQLASAEQVHRLSNDSLN
jgi:hypothetical protein